MAVLGEPKSSTLLHCWPIQVFLLYEELIVYLDVKSKTDGENILPGVFLKRPPRALKVAFSSVPTHPSMRVAVLSNEECFVCSYWSVFQKRRYQRVLSGGRQEG